MTVVEYCDMRLKEALAKLAELAARDYAEDASRQTGLHPDYYMPVKPRPVYPGPMKKEK